MIYDLLVVCGDSFTEGCKDVLNITPEDTWPGLVADHYKIPFVTLGTGGASNLEIALQPIQSITPTDLAKIKSAKNPLFLFAFTIHERLAVADAQTGIIKSAYTTVPELLTAHQDYRFLTKYATYLNTIMVSPLDPDNLCEAINGLYNYDIKKQPEMYNWYVHSTLQSIRMCMNWHAFFDNATIKWGFIHHYYPYDTIFTNQDRPERPIDFPYIDDCFNSATDYYPVQSILRVPADVISEIDGHPNIRGIHKLTKFFISYIDSLNNDK